ncbi:MAG TPA: DNA-directed RNA polymerase subunit beta [Firmicutes bacterium]|nr:DNA-directed RNA polymerase subunit beta [Bacillota bacterium]
MSNSSKKIIERKSFANIKTELEVPNLLLTQFKSYENFLQKEIPPEERKSIGLQSAFKDTFPIYNDSGTLSLEFVSYHLGKLIYSERECKEKGLTYSVPLKLKVMFVIRDIDEVTGEKRIKEIKEEDIFLGDIPLMTDRGTFIINGAERVVVSQLHRSPGVTFLEDEGKLDISGQKLFTAKLIPYFGSWLEFEYDTNNFLYIVIDRKKKFYITVFLKALGYSVEEIIKLFYETRDINISKPDRDYHGWVISRDIINETTGEVIAEAGAEIDSFYLKKFALFKINQIEVVDQDKVVSYTILNTLQKDATVGTDLALEQIYKKLRPGYPVSPKLAKELFENLFFNPKRYSLGKVGRYKLNKKFNLSIPEDTMVLTREDVIATIAKLISINAEIEESDDIDHLSNRRVRSVGELAENAVRSGLAKMAKSISDKLNFPDVEDLQPYDIIVTKHFTSSMNDFFGRGQLSQFMDQINPLAEITNKRRLSALGPGGLHRKRAGFKVRDIHPTHYGRICPIETPEGPNIGLITSLATYAKVNEYGLIETPYRKVVNGRLTEEITYMTADESDKYIITQATTKFDSSGKILDKIVYGWRKGEVLTVDPKDIEYIDVSPTQLVSISSALIPFLEHDDANRALMGSNMQRQSVPLLFPRPPIVGTGMEKIVAKDSGMALVAKRSGTVTYADADKIIIEPDKKEDEFDKEDIYHLQKFQRSNQDTCINQTPIVNIGEKIKAGDILSNGMSIADSELALGNNVIVAFMPWEGYNFEDAILISENLLKSDTFTSVHIQENKIEARMTKLGPEEITRDVPNVNERQLIRLDEEGIVKVGSFIEPGDILVGKVTPRGETELTGEEKLLKIIFGKKAGDVRNTSLIADQRTKGVVIDVKVFSRNENELDEGSKKQIQDKIKALKDSSDVEKHRLEKKYIKDIFESIKRAPLKQSLKDAKGKIVIKKGDSLNESGIIYILENKIDLVSFYSDLEIIERLTVLQEKFKDRVSRINNQLKKEIDIIKRSENLPAGVLKSVTIYTAQKRKVTVGDKMAGRHGNKGVVARILPAEDMPYLKDGTPVDLVLNPLGVPSRMNIGQIFETLLSYVGYILNEHYESPVFDGAKEEDLKRMFKKCGLKDTGKFTLYDGRTGDPFEQDVTVGIMYMMKLNHLAEDKIHARSTGPYSLVTQQPLGGKAQMGGQRLGEMEVWALEAYGAAFTLQEMLTIKSDDIDGRLKVFESIIKGENPSSPGIPESFHVMVKELQGLCFDMELFEDKEDKTKLSGLKIRLASSDKIRSWSYGEVKKAETINYRTFKSERDGLFCERIFGPTKNWRCQCGKFKGKKFKGTRCDRCGVEITEKSERRRRMGHIELAEPVANVLFFHGSLSNYMGYLLDMKVKDIEKCIYYESYIVTDPGKTPLKYKQVLSERLYRQFKTDYGENSFKADIGAKAIKKLLSNLDIPKMYKELRLEIKDLEVSSESSLKDKKIVKKMKIVRSLYESDNRPEWMILEVLPVIPPDLRPLVPLEGSRFAASDLNDLYRRVINRNNRLKKFKEAEVPDIIVKNEKRMLQEAVDTLFDNGRRGREVLGSNKRPLKSLCEMLRSKRGRFRQNLLGKRVDYSGRAVIVVNPKLKLTECGLPKEIGLELFEPFIKHRMKVYDDKKITQGLRIIKYIDEQPQMLSFLQKEFDRRLVLLNRAPTLHRLGIQAFRPKLVSGKAIHMHPLVCAAFNADFDGDQVAVHLPLSVEAQLESRLLMWSRTNILSPANGEPIVVPSQDMILGIYYLTKDVEGGPDNPIPYSNVEELELAYFHKKLTLHQPIKYSLPTGEVIITTPGRVIFNSILPESVGFVNKTIAKNDLKAIIFKAYKTNDRDRVIRMLDEIKSMGFKYSTIGGITFGLFDIVIPPEKYPILSETETEIKKINDNFKKGIITDVERYKTIIDKWARTNYLIQAKMLQTLKQGNDEDKRTLFNPIYIMYDSKARGSEQQIRQLAGMRGLMEKPSGEIIEIPIQSNFREGLKVLEYFLSSHGARKGLADTALKTSESGYLTRRLVDVAQDLIVSEHDCGTNTGIEITELRRGDRVYESLASRLVGRFTASEVKDPITGKVICKKNTYIDEDLAWHIQNSGVKTVTIRSVLTCQTKRGLCQNCYGRDLGTGEFVEMGEAIGIIAAQSIGEPGTQLTMRTFHIGGITSKRVEKEDIVANLLTIVKGGIYRIADIESQIIQDGFVKDKTLKHKKTYFTSSGVLEVFSENYSKPLRIEFNPNNGMILKISVDKREYEKVNLLRGTVKYRLQYNKVPNSNGEIRNLSRDAEIIILSDRIEDKEVVVDPKTSEISIIFTTAGEDIKHPKTKAVICPKGHIINASRANEIVKAGYSTIKVFVELERYRIPYGAKMIVKNGSVITKQTTIAVKTLYFEPILSEDDGKVEFIDLYFRGGLSGLEENYKVVIKPPTLKPSEEIQPRINIGNAEIQIPYLKQVKGAGKGEKDRIITYINVNEGEVVKKGDVIGKLIHERTERSDITGGLLQVEELFEARERKPAENAILSEIAGTIDIETRKEMDKRRGKERLKTIIKVQAPRGEVSYLVSHGKQVIVKIGDQVEAGDPLTSGLVNLHDLLRIKNIAFIRRYIVDQVKMVYKVQNVDINDKHIEVIVKKMLSKVRIKSTGDTSFVIGDYVNVSDFNDENERIRKQNGKPAEGDRTLLGISKVALETDSFISAASFQETIRVMSEAALSGKFDPMHGLKENVIMGHLIPAGTGNPYYSGIRLFQEELLTKDEEQFGNKPTEEEEEALEETSDLEIE